METMCGWVVAAHKSIRIEAMRAVSEDRDSQILPKCHHFHRISTSTFVSSSLFLTPLLRSLLVCMRVERPRFSASSSARSESGQTPPRRPERSTTNDQLCSITDDSARVRLAPTAPTSGATDSRPNQRRATPPAAPDDDGRDGSRRNTNGGRHPGAAVRRLPLDTTGQGERVTVSRKAEWEWKEKSIYRDQCEEQIVGIPWLTFRSRELRLLM